MNMNRLPCCSLCNSIYQIRDLNGAKVPMLLNCGHDICRYCLNFTYRKNKQVICNICQTNCRIDCESQIYNIPIHYYIVGKVFYLSSKKLLKLNHDISNINLTNLTIESPRKFKKICEPCNNYVKYFCQQCDEVYCENCYQQIHLENHLLSKHDIEVIDYMSSESKCNRHLKPYEFVCLTCQLHLCSFCLYENHREHDIYTLENYNTNSVKHVQSKGEILLKKLNYCKHEFNVKLKQCQDSHSKKKNNDYENNKKNITSFVSSVIGTLQFIEHTLLNTLYQSDLNITNSINKIINQLNNSIHDLQTKLNTVNVLVKNKQHSSSLLLNTISDIEYCLNTTYYIAQKNEMKTSIVFNNNIYGIINQCIISEIDISDAYIITNSPELPSNYSLNSVIGINSGVLSEKSTSSITKNLITSSNNSITNIDAINSITFDYTSIKEITKNEIEPVIVTHVNSPSDFYLQLDANKHVMKMIDNELYISTQNEHNFVKHIIINNVIYAVKINTNNWCRGVVIYVDSEDDKKKYTVHCIDYGFTRTLTGDRNLPINIASIPALAFNCALYELKPKATTGWSNEAYTLFCDLMLVKYGSFFVYPLDMDSERIEVDVVWKEYIYPLSIRDTMFFLGHGSSEDYINLSLHKEFINTVTLPETINLEIENEYLVFLSHFNSIDEFYLQIDSERFTLLEETMKLLEITYKPTEMDIHKSHLLYTPQIGMAVAARYSIDLNWYRAKIIHLPEPRMVTVFYIDYGNSETLPWDQLRVLDKNLIKIPPLARKASLANVQPAVDGIEYPNWSDKISGIFLDLLSSDQSVENNLSAKVHEIDNDVHKVILYNRTSNGNYCVNGKLVSQGYATTLNPSLFILNKQSLRKQYINQIPLQMNSRNNEILLPLEDTLLFIKQRSVIESESCTWSQNNKNTPGTQMSIVKIVSPDEIVLKDFNYNLAELTEHMNEMYSSKKKKKTQKCNWKLNDLCAVFILKYGNWYRGRIVKMEPLTGTASVYLYDLDETYDEMSIDKLIKLKQKFINEKCGILHCCMNNLIPLGTSDGKWPKFSCDRLIEEMKKYLSVYFLKKDNKDGKASGEIWARDVEIPEALEPISDRWININKFMIEQGFAVTKNQYLKKLSSSPSGSEHNNLSEISEYTKSFNSWLPPTPITVSQFNGFISYVDFNCHLCIQNMDNDTPQLLKDIQDELNCIYSNSNPEPINVKWSKGQMVIVNYHLDNCWYRGTILKEEKNGNYVVEFLDYGNIETCSREKLRSTLYMTDIPQLCLKGFFSTILPLTNTGKWTTPLLDFIHSRIVDKPFSVTLDLTKSTDNYYAVTKLKDKDHSNFCQYLVSEGFAYFEFVDPSLLSLSKYLMFEKNFNQTESLTDAITEEKSDDKDIDTIVGTTIKNDNDKENRNIQNIKQINEIQENSNSLKSSDNKFTEIKKESNVQNNNNTFSEDDEEDINYNIQTSDEIEELGFSKFCLEPNDIIEGTLCHVVEPTQMIFMIMKISGVDITSSKEEMFNSMYEKCEKLPVLNKIVPDTAVAVLYNILWRRGIVSHNCRSVFLVDFGISIKLVKNNLKLCPPEFFKLPMFSIHCQLTNVVLSEYASAKDVMEKLSILLKGVTLKIIGINEIDDQIIGVELYNNKDEIAYQPLIDSKLLIPK